MERSEQLHVVADLSPLHTLPALETSALIKALRAGPMHVYDDLAARSRSAPPEVPGFYAWWQTPGALPGVPGSPHPSAPFELLYVGIAPRDGRSKSNLRKRLSNHHRAAIGSSTFRLDLAAFLWEEMGWAPEWTDRPVLSKEELNELGNWQREYLRVQWIEVQAPWLIEAEVVREMGPPLNREHNAHHQFYSEIGLGRGRLRRAARTGTH